MDSTGVLPSDPDGAVGRVSHIPNKLSEHGFAARGAQVIMNRSSPLTNHASAPLVIYSSRTPYPGSSYK